MAPVETAVIADLLQQGMAEGKRPFLTVKSNSMAPLLRRGDQIQVEPAAATALRPGDIIVMAGGAELLTHRFWRLIDVDGRLYLVTRGDRPLTYDTPRPADELVGRIITRRRDGRLLAIKGGRGGWLNRRLAGLAEAEMRLLAGRQTDVVRPNLVAAGLPGHSSYGDGRRLGPRLVRRLVYTWATLLTAVVARLPNDKKL